MKQYSLYQAAKLGLLLESRNGNITHNLKTVRAIAEKVGYSTEQTRNGITKFISQKDIDRWNEAVKLIK